MSKYPSIMCIKDWKTNAGESICEYKKGKKYKVTKVILNNHANIVNIRTISSVGGNFDCNFCSGSEYFEVDEYINGLNIL